MDKIILDLCGGTGAWSKPYKEAGYDVRLVTLPKYDVRSYEPPENVYGILMAPPCTVFSLAGNRWKRTKEEIQKALSVVYACLKIKDNCKPVFWCLENPVGKLVNYIGKPAMYFHPYEYGDHYTKKTALWGKFNHPPKQPTWHIGSSMHLYVRDPVERAITPSGFARAFFEANR